MIIIFIVGMILTTCLGFAVNYIVFTGLQLYTTNPNIKKFNKLKENILIAFLFGATQFALIYTLKENDITLDFISSQILMILFFVCLGIGWLIGQSVENIAKRNYLQISLAIIFFMSALYLMILEKK